MENSIKDIITNSLEQARSVIDADTVVGQPIRTESGTLIIPISKISIGMATGGLDLSSKDASGTKFGGGGGTGVSISPIGFLTVYPNGAVEMLPISTTPNTPIEQIADFIDRAPELVNRIKSIFTKNDDDDAEIAAIEAALAAQEAYDAKQAEVKIADDEDETVKLSAKELKKLEKLQKKEAKKNAKK